MQPMARRYLACVLASVALHFAVTRWSPSERASSPSPADSVASLRRAGLGELSAAARRSAVAELRAQHVASARLARDEGRLRLGRFLIVANALDAFEAGVALDVETSVERYAARLASLDPAIARLGVPGATAEVFGDLHYVGLPGGRMADLLATGSGSCEPLSHLLAASLHDLGHGARLRLRFWGAPVGDATHLTPIWSDASGELDLVTQEPPTPGGASFPAEVLVEAYARTHGLAPGALGAHAELDAGEPAPRSDTVLRSMTAGYPANHDRFEGGLPLWSDRAIRARDGAPSRAAAARADATPSDPSAELAQICAFAVPLGSLDPARVAAELGHDRAAVELYRVPSITTLERLSQNLIEVERLRPSFAGDRARRAVGLSCLAALYDHAALAFALANEPTIAARAAREAKLSSEGAREAFAALDLGATSEDRARLTTELAGPSWLLLHVEGGDRIVERLVDDTVAQVQLHTALLLHPSTRLAAERRAAKLDPETMVLVLHELWRVHGEAGGAGDAHADATDDADAARFRKAHRAFTPLARALWSETAELLPALDRFERSSLELGLDRDARLAIVTFFTRNVTWLHAHRASVSSVLGALDQWVSQHDYGSVDELEPRFDWRALRRGLAARPR